MAEISYRQERLTAEAYIEFLTRTDLGSQYPRERFRQRIGTLVEKASISLTARDEAGQVVGVCLGITDFSYWLFITDLGVDRRMMKQGIGKSLLTMAHQAAGGEKDICMYTCANEGAIGFYEKMGMKLADDVMQLNHIEWTAFTVGEDA